MEIVNHRLGFSLKLYLVLEIYLTTLFIEDIDILECKVVNFQAIGILVRKST